MNETLIFIDEAFLEKLSKHFGKGKYLKFDKILFANNLAKKQNLSCKQIFYYTAPPFQGTFPDILEEKLKKGYDQFVHKLKEKGVLVREGRCQRIKLNDGAIKFLQKGVDTLLTIDLISVPIKYPEIKEIILIACDSDFVPVIKTLKELGIRVNLHTYYEKKRNTNFSRSNDLIKSANRYILLKKEDFERAKI